jgi:hypothetical protein
MAAKMPRPVPKSREAKTSGTTGLTYDYLMDDSPSSRLNMLEREICEYMDASLSTVVNQVTMELRTLLMGSETIDTLVHDATESLCAEVRKLVCSPLEPTQMLTPLDLSSLFSKDFVIAVAEGERSASLLTVNSLRTLNGTLAAQISNFCDSLTTGTTSCCEGIRRLRKSKKESALRGIRRDKKLSELNRRLAHLDAEQVELQVSRQGLDLKQTQKHSRDTEEIVFLGKIGAAEKKECFGHGAALRRNHSELQDCLAELKALRRIFERRSREFFESCQRGPGVDVPPYGKTKSVLDSYSSYSDENEDVTSIGTEVDVTFDVSRSSRAFGH